MGLWTLEEAKQQNIPAPTIEDALKVRAYSREKGGNFATKIVAMLRNQFGGHAVKKEPNS
jgi:6-phosphogluconate dehydrogenase